MRQVATGSAPGPPCAVRGDPCSRLAGMPVLSPGRALAIAWLIGCGRSSSTFTELADQLPPEWLDGGVADAHGGVPLRVDPEASDSVTALADCAATVSVCLERTKGDFVRCVRQVPACETEEPWREDAPCCPQACKDQFRERTRAGASGFDAYVAVFATDGSCVPGLESRTEP